MLNTILRLKIEIWRKQYIVISALARHVLRTASSGQMRVLLLVLVHGMMKKLSFTIADSPVNVPELMAQKDTAHFSVIQVHRTMQLIKG